MIALQDELNIDEYQSFVEENHGLIFHFLHKYHLPKDEYYDLAAIALCNAAMTYREDTGFTFASYAMVCMVNAWHGQYRDEMSKRNGATLERIDCEEVSVLPVRENFVRDICTKDVFERLYLRCSPKEKETVRGMLLGYTAREIADACGVSHQCVTERVKKIRDKMKPLLTC